MPSRTWAHHRTAHLRLDAPVESDIPALFAIHADPAVWAHYPSLRHPDDTQARKMIAAHAAKWEHDGLAGWTVRTADDGIVVGFGGCSRQFDGMAWWNLGYRLSASRHGRGYGTELVLASIDAAAAVEADLPIVATLLEHNVVSARLAEKAGLSLQWRGPDTDNPHPAAIRLIYADRRLTRHAVEMIRAKG